MRGAHACNDTAYVSLCARMPCASGERGNVKVMAGCHVAGTSRATGRPLVSVKGGIRSEGGLPRGRYKPGDRPPQPQRTFQNTWRARCEGEWQRAFYMFSFSARAPHLLPSLLTQARSLKHLLLSSVTTERRFCVSCPTLSCALLYISSPA